jgi:hypothetical protein
MESATEAFTRLMPAPQRGEIVRQFERNYENKEALGKGFYEMGNLYKKDMEKFRK